MSCKPLLCGTLWNLGRSGFIDGEYNYELTREEWRNELEQMQKIGFDHLMLFAGVQYCLERTRQKTAAAGPDLLEFLYGECDKRNMKIIVSSGFYPGWWEKWKLDEALEFQDKTIGEIFSRYGNHPSFQGWYLDYEIYMRWGSEAGIIRELYRGIVDRCKSFNNKLPVFVSPFFMPDTVGKCMDFKYAEPAEYVDFWSDLLSYSGIDVLALQDTGGQHLSCFTEKDTEPFIEAFATACRNSGTRLWGNVETGELPVKDLDEFVRKYGAEGDVNNVNFRKDWRPVSIERLIAKLELMSKYSERNMTWGYREFYRPCINSDAKKHYNAYAEYFDMMKGKDMGAV